MLLHGVAVVSLLQLYWGAPRASLRERMVALLVWAPWRALAVGVLLGACGLVVALCASRIAWASARVASHTGRG